MAVPDKCKLQVAGNHVGNGLHHNQSILESSFLSENPMPEEEVLLSFSRLCGFGNLQGRVQFLDRQHLLIKFCSVDVGRNYRIDCNFYLSIQNDKGTTGLKYGLIVLDVMSRSADHHPAFFAVYNMETTEVIAFYQNSAEELYFLFEQFCDHFHATSSLSTTFITSHSNNIYALEQLRCNKSKANGFQQFVKKMLASLPFNCQSQSPSPYFDQSLFRYDEKLISATDRHRQSTDHPIKFIARRQQGSLKFKIKPVRTKWMIMITWLSKLGPEAGSIDSRTKKISSFLFHPILPLALSIQQTMSLQPSVVNIHFRR
ncbi:hypothetical protein RHMOL_Rhmol01G0096400 [Rhododendron molle]|uniref:Uncharacterized protein n=1 Tax=Rhododendron molle TaxID=49168 RepID=A0ACC0Q2E3_RHOML|nr:hypothetical protein RHMOL_Rhmol01G0096400 [Rhododendron molle]